MTYTLKTLPKKVKETILSSHHLKNVDEHRKTVLSNKFFKKDDNAVVDLFGDFDLKVTPDIEYTDTRAIWATDNYESKGLEYNFSAPINDLSIIVPRVQKSKEEQKRRVKEKAEVFTPSWVCNVQNNLIDDDILGKGSFNTILDNDRQWIPSQFVDFSHVDKYSWKIYSMERRLEMTCGEAPYLMSPYDTTTGKIIPVRDSDGLFQRIGILDRKLRVITENSTTDEWNTYALIALCNTFGNEWQGDNLLLARLNFLNTYIEYYVDALSSEPSAEDILDVAEISSWNIWQMDGLKMVEPDSCSPDCKACKNKKRAGHDGLVSVIRFITPQGFEYKSFEDLLPNDMFQQ